MVGHRFLPLTPVGVIPGRRSRYGGQTVNKSPQRHVTRTYAALLDFIMAAEQCPRPAGRGCSSVGRAPRSQ